MSNNPAVTPDCAKYQVELLLRLAINSFKEVNAATGYEQSIKLFAEKHQNDLYEVGRTPPKDLDYSELYDWHDSDLTAMERDSLKKPITAAQHFFKLCTISAEQDMEEHGVSVRNIKTKEDEEAESQAFIEACLLNETINHLCRRSLDSENVTFDKKKYAENIQLVLAILMSRGEPRVKQIERVLSIRRMLKNYITQSPRLSELVAYIPGLLTLSLNDLYLLDTDPKWETSKVAVPESYKDFGDFKDTWADFCNQSGKVKTLVNTEFQCREYKKHTWWGESNFRGFSLDPTVKWPYVMLSERVLKGLDERRVKLPRQYRASYIKKKALATVYESSDSEEEDSEMKEDDH